MDILSELDQILDLVCSIRQKLAFDPEPFFDYRSYYKPKHKYLIKNITSFESDKKEHKGKVYLLSSFCCHKMCYPSQTECSDEHLVLEFKKIDNIKLEEDLRLRADSVDIELVE